MASKIYEYDKQITVIRNEIKNIRKQLNNLKYQHKKDIATVKDILGDRLPKSNQTMCLDKDDAENSLDWRHVTPIGYVKSVFKSKNGTPRQSGVVPTARATLSLVPGLFTNPEHSLEGLEQYSYVWIIFAFHQNNSNYTKAKVKPPRLNGAKTGLFSTRCPYRPNPIGLSLIKVDYIQGNTLHLSGVDLIDGTPVLDIKPYIPQYDQPPLRTRGPGYKQESKSTKGISTKKVEKAACVNIEIPSDLECETDTEDCYISELKTLVESEVQPQRNCHVSKFCQLESTYNSDLEYDTDTAELDCNESMDTNEHEVTFAVPKVQEDGNSSIDINDSCSCNQIKEEHAINYSNSVERNTDVLCKVRHSPINYYPTSRENDASDANCKFMEVMTNEIKPMTAKPHKNSCQANLRANNTNKNPVTHLSIPGQSSCKSDVHDVTNIIDVADWVSSPPISTLNVRFTRFAENQFADIQEAFANCELKTEHLKSAQDLREAIENVLRNDPRSTYRRNKCSDKLYYVVFDCVHVTSWFDDEMKTVEVLKLKW